ncbi:DUF5958 family protein [Pelagibius sp.]|uniref:DUF5958 family protein n=1 Tax=Pelagibius sp. TaxID=1931238 RepID=UPI003B50A0BE
MLGIRTEIYLNQLAQGIVPMSTGAGWFEEQDDERQVDVLRALAVFAREAGTTGEAAAAAIQQSKLRPTFTPCVIMAKAAEQDSLGSGSIRRAFAKIISLPASERQKSFALLVALLRVADDRRRHNCGACTRHWWHRDLSDPSVVEEVVAGRR